MSDEDPPKSLAEKYAGPPRKKAFDEVPERAATVMAANKGLALMLDFQRRTGDRIALPYSYLVPAFFEPHADKDVVTLGYTTRSVVIEGRNLARLFGDILEHKRTGVSEIAPRHDGKATDDEAVTGLVIEDGDEPVVKALTRILARRDRLKESTEGKGSDTSRQVGSPMLDLVLITGDHVALPYAYLQAMPFDLSASLALEFSGFVVKLRGRNLTRLYGDILAHKRSSVAEIGQEPEDEQAAEGTMTVHQITVEET